MKYMGSKRWMLFNGLEELISSRIHQHERFVDLFCGSSAVSNHVALNHDVPVLANDLQKFCRVLAEAVVCRTELLGRHWINSWINRATDLAHNHPLFEVAQKAQHCSEQLDIICLTSNAREICNMGETPITSAYGGYYFSPLQAIYFDCLRSALPSKHLHQMAALAALVRTASACVASPGHTAQPFRATTTSEPHIRRAWKKDVFQLVRNYALRLSKIASLKKGEASVCDANTLANDLNEGDLVFIDPPYSSVHYSRFYHVLETIVLGTYVPVTGIGRYPPSDLRPRSRYSLSSKARLAMYQLLETIAECNSSVIITFPEGEASNGLKGQDIVDIASNWFTIECKKTVTSKFSTLGGNYRNRSARVISKELLLSLDPK